MITKPEQEILSEICKDSRHTLRDIQTIIGKVCDDELSFDLNLQAARYSRIEEKAAESLGGEKKHYKKENLTDRTKRWAAIQADTLFNISTPHIAEMIISRKSENLDRIKNTVENSPVVHNMVYEFAEEFIGFEEESIRILKTYL